MHMSLYSLGTISNFLRDSKCLLPTPSPWVGLMTIAPLEEAVACVKLEFMLGILILVAIAMPPSILKDLRSLTTSLALARNAKPLPTQSVGIGSATLAMPPSPGLRSRPSVRCPSSSRRTACRCLPSRPLRTARARRALGRCSPRPSPRSSRAARARRARTAACASWASTWATSSSAPRWAAYLARRRRIAAPFALASSQLLLRSPAHSYTSLIMYNAVL
mmetsp:Transcript_46494/g.123418  ORF Transcript_46494/g.123418 Transcript_46494/m.123418 type:complete len:220 (+) Transcript_46494:96-755(+)